MTRASKSACRLIETYVARWLRETKMGSDIVQNFGFEAAMDHVFELLNAGYLKITGDEEGFTGIEVRNPPEPPRGEIRRTTGLVQ